MNKHIEEFRDVKGYEGFYQVSNLGRVKSLERKVRNGKGYRLVKEKFLKNIKDYYGYVIVALNKDRKFKSAKVHKLVAIAFLGHEPCGHKLVVDHINHNKNDNRLENLRVVTQRENANLKHINSSSKYTGVSWYKRYNKWRSCIYKHGKFNHIGYYEKEFEAHLAYQKELKLINKTK